MGGLVFEPPKLREALHARGDIGSRKRQDKMRMRKGKQMGWVERSLFFTRKVELVDDDGWKGSNLRHGHACGTIVVS